MLKITTLRHDGRESTLKLEGKLLAAWVGELLAVCGPALHGAGRLRLDLSELSFADVSGITALRDLMRQGATITTASPLVGELLKEI